MSTSHYTNTNYSAPNPALTSPSRTDDYPEPMMNAVADWQNPLSHPSLAHSRPACSDIGADTLRLTDGVPANVRRPRRSPLLAAVALLTMGVGLLILDGCALAHYADEAFEAVVIALVSAPAAVFVLATAFVVRGIRR